MYDYNKLFRLRVDHEQLTLEPLLLISATFQTAYVGT